MLSTIKLSTHGSFQNDTTTQHPPQTTTPNISPQQRPSLLQSLKSLMQGMMMRMWKVVVDARLPSHAIQMTTKFYALCNVMKKNRWKIKLSCVCICSPLTQNLTVRNIYLSWEMVAMMIWYGSMVKINTQLTLMMIK